MAHLNISLDQGLADELVRTVPRRQRSAYVAAAIGEKIARDRQVAGIRESACAWDNGGRGDFTPPYLAEAISSTAMIV